MNVHLLGILQLSIVILNVLYDSTTATLPTNNNAQKSKEELKTAVKNLLNIDRYPLNSDNHPKRHYRSDNAAVKYMQKLFEVYNKNKRYNNKGTIIRSINPKAEVFNNNNTLSFDVSSLRRNEDILRAELHLNTHSKASPIKAKAKRYLQVNGIGYGSQIKLDMLSERSDWLGYDATKLLRDIRSRNGTVLLVQVLKKENTVKNTDILRKYTPFLLVYSKPEGDIAEREFIEAIKDDENRAPKELKTRVKRGSDYYVYRSNKNQISEDDINLKKFRNVGPAILRRRSKNLRHSNRRKKINKTDQTDPMLGFGTVVDNHRSDVQTSKREEKDEEISMVLLDNPYAGKKCAKRKMTVNFDEIGWGEYVVQPPSFEANYCSGVCTFHLDKFTNSHAIFQSLMHTAGVNPYVPNVSCTPDRFDSQTLLYFHDNNLVLRTFPKMIVTSCGCN